MSRHSHSIAKTESSISTQANGNLEFPSRLSVITDWAFSARVAKYNCENLAGECLVSKRQLERFFLAKFKQTPKAWMQVFRMELARELMAQGYTTKAAANDLHFKSCSHFCREFKKYYGRKPQSYSPKPKCRVSSIMSPFAQPSALPLLEQTQ